MKNIFLFTAALGLSAGLIGCTDGTHDQPNIELIQDFMITPAIKPQTLDEHAPNKIGMRVPPDNTVPVGFKPYAYGTNAEKAAKENKNPLSGNESEAVLKVGEKYFETNCAVCHGFKGEGGEHTSVGEKMNLKPPSLLSEKIRKMSDGGIYHIVTMGQGVMGPYASHVPQEYRWQVINYVRNLQKNSEK